jgi:hypothetical protein
MRQIQGQEQTLPILASAPADGDSSGLDMTLFTGGLKVSKYFATLTSTGGGTATYALWLRHPTSQKWFEVVDGGNIGGVAGGSALGDGRYTFIMANLGVFDMVALVQTITAGGPVATATLCEILENNFTRGD